MTAARLRQPAATADETTRLRDRARLRLSLRHAWLTELLGSSEGEGFALACALNAADRMEDEQAWREGRPEQAALDLGARTSEPGRLARLAEVLGLEPPEALLLELCAAMALDPELERLAAALPASAGGLTPLLASRLLALPLHEIWPADGLLARWAVAGTGPGGALWLDPAVRDWLCGRPSLDPVLAGVCEIVPALEPLSGWPVEYLAGEAARLLREREALSLRILVSGPPGAGRRSFAAAVAHRLGLPLLSVDADRVSDAEWSAVGLHAQRQAFLHGCALFWSGASAAQRRLADAPAAFPLQFLGLEPNQSAPPHAGAERRIELPPPTVADRARLWRHHVPESAGWAPGEADALARRFEALPGEIAGAAARGARSVAAVNEHFRSQSAAGLDQTAQLLRAGFTWDDLVAPAPLRLALEEFAYEARERALFWEQPEARRMFPEGRGLAALMSGPPGTGKTMSAQVLAGELGLPLCRVNLASVLSKWVGDLARNLERLFQEAARRRMILLFDEADALFAKRVNEARDAQDRYANMDSSHLMTAIERFEGVVLLTTNLKGNIDPAFLRRIRYCMEFSRPDEAARLAIWERAVAGLAGAQAASRVAPRLSRLAAMEASGAQIKNATLSAVFIAGRAAAPLDVEHLLAGLSREFAKDGYALSEREMRSALDG